MTLAEAKKIFQPDFLKQLTGMSINGNFGDAVMNPDTVPIIEYFLEQNPNISINISTNGGARDKQFWTRLAELRVHILFCIDGLEDTHSIYRQNTVFSTVIKNAQIVINNGGRAIWKMIEFDHNTHQLSAAEELSKQLGFALFFVSPGRSNNNSPVFNNRGEQVYTMGKVGTVNLTQLVSSRERRPVTPIKFTGKINDPIVCEVQTMRSVYVDSTGGVYPCCHMGYNPKEFNKPENYQYKDLIERNNANEHDLSTCIEWFNHVSESWSKPTFADGRLKICNDVCGQKNTQ
jgi:sulfatase maturation enzyme AslB (radical SAM superfamily)